MNAEVGGWQAGDRGCPLGDGVDGGDEPVEGRLGELCPNPASGAPAIHSFEAGASVQCALTGAAARDDASRTYIEWADGDPELLRSPRGWLPTERPTFGEAAAYFDLDPKKIDKEACWARTQDGGYDSLKFIGKGGKPADIPLPVPVMRAVRVVVDERTTGPLLRNRVENALTTLDARRMVNRIATIAGCWHITPHGLRRTFRTAGLVSGVPMRDMQIAMRHADPRTTGLYDMAKNNKDRHASHRVASFLAGMTG